MLVTLLRSGLGPKEILFYGIIMLFALTLSFSFHEFMHAFVADRLGDPTPRNMGRLTLNPLAHLDVVGTILLLTAGFGWGKPVMYNPSRLNKFRSSRLMNIMVHLAGVTGNFILALLSGIISTVITCLMAGRVDPESNAYIAISAIALAFSYTMDFSLMLLAFNLLPIPPLDGFHVLEELLPYRLKMTEGYRKFEMFAPYGILVLFVLSYATGISILSEAIKWIRMPFAIVINMVCGLIEQLFT
ncbi:MAG: site-2 protease family protein [Ruminococcaceae bacterium]|nr:site-2 protease family protein [Oscillospiraceae bacterium]